MCLRVVCDPELLRLFLRWGMERLAFLEIRHQRIKAPPFIPHVFPAVVIFP